MTTPSASVSAPDGLVFELETDRHTYAPGDPIRATLRVRSQAADDIVLRFGSGQRYDLVIERDGTVAWRWSEGMFFIQVLGQERLAPGEEISYSESYEGELAPGTYTVRGSLVSPSHPVEASVEVSVTAG